MSNLDYIDRFKTIVEQSLNLGIEHAPELFWMYTQNIELPIKKFAHGVYSAPVLTYAETRYFLEFAKLAKASNAFEPNTEEETPYQIPELILQGKAKEIADTILQERLVPIFQVLYGVTPDEIVSAQLAWYTPEGVAGTDWHLDADSDMTCVVSLDPSMYTGGGTAIRPYGPCDETVIVPPVPAGNGLLFNGKYNFHRGLPVDSGDRILLVYWLKTNG